MKKRRLIVLTFSFVFIFLVGCSSPESRETIFSYVNENYELLEKFPYDELNKLERWDDEYIEFIRNHLGNDTIVMSVYAWGEDIIAFSCLGWGLSVGAIYTGFYFSRNDTPFALDFGDGSNLEEIQPGVFYWQCDERSTRNIRTERIRDNWFYYLMEWR
jgi:hypothetical protein